MEDITTIEKLDKIINCLKEKETEDIRIDDLSEYTGIDQYFLTRLLVKLRDDNYVIYSINYSLTVDGYVLQQTGGFKNLVDRKLNELLFIEETRNRQKYVEDKMIENTKRLNDLTRGLLIATIFLAVFALASLLLPYFISLKRN